MADDIGARIRQLRRSRGIHQATLARALGLPAQTLSNYELGPNKVPAAILPRVADALGVSLYELFGQAPPESASTAEPTAELAAQLKRLLDLGPERVQVTIQVQLPEAAATEEPELPLEVRALRRLVQAWPDLDEAAKEEFLRVSDQVRKGRRDAGPS